jgi:hypothetical protein
MAFLYFGQRNICVCVCVCVCVRIHFQTTLAISKPKIKVRERVDVKGRSQSERPTLGTIQKISVLNPDIAHESAVFVHAATC